MRICASLWYRDVSGMCWAVASSHTISAMASARRRHVAAVSSLAPPVPLTRRAASWPRAVAHLVCSV
eukprot:4585971-Lingulodinium_polyedra.AAC.1